MPGLLSRDGPHGGRRGHRDRGLKPRQPPSGWRWAPQEAPVQEDMRRPSAYPAAAAGRRPGTT